MLDIRILRKDPDRIRRALDRLHTDAPLDDILAADEHRRKLLVQVEELKARRNRVSKEISMEKDPEVRNEKIIQMRRVGDEISALDLEVKKTDCMLYDLMLQIPNMPHESVPEGASEEENIVVRIEGDTPVFDFEPKPHWEICEKLGIIDFERGVKISGSRFYILRGPGAQLQRAVTAFMLDLHVQKHGYTEIYPPFMVKRECMVGTGQLPKFGENIYRDDEDDFYFIPTAEVPVTNMHADEIFEPGILPLYYTAFTACFRREKMSAGRDVRGIKRGHQFDKVEMVKFVDPRTSYDELERLLSDAEDVCRNLKICHRVVEMCAGDLSFVASKKYDVEMWAPGCSEWLEVSSCSNFEDFQARRANIRFRREKGGKPEFVHTLNGSGLALPRTLIAIFETYQQADGSVRIPDVLVPYMGGRTSIAA
ncbi:serine--tRNA ligase [bacterium]|nr:serine--tRNA ligase [candidate division CSSED10-310 bacterium]